MNSPIDLPRFLSKSTASEYWKFDAVVIGSGVAGLMCAMKLAPHMRVALITKERLVDSNSFYAQGGLSAVVHNDDSIDLWKKDTLGAGAGLCRLSAVETVSSQMLAIVTELTEMGVPFDVDSDGNLQLGREAFHSVRRILHAGGDQTGSYISQVMSEQIESNTRVSVFQESFVIDILPDANGEVAGLSAVVDDMDVIFVTPHVVLSTGGCGQAYSHTSNPRVATGDGIAMALRAGASLVDMEFIQYHPTVCFAEPSKPFLVTEAIRGEGAKLYNDKGERFMSRYSEMMELAPRDIVSKACFDEIQKQEKEWVLLDTTIFDKTYLKTHFPTVYSQCISAGFNPSEQPIPVSPGAHYTIGGIEADTKCQTSLPGLFVAGEAGSTGMHGANRLASNSLPEALATGVSSAKIVMDSNRPMRYPDRPAVNKTKDVLITRSELRKRNWSDIGVVREQTDMNKHLDMLRKSVRYPLPTSILGAMELANLFTVSTAITMSAIVRKESRGVHNRLDHPNSYDRWSNKRVHINSKPSDDRTEIKTGTHKGDEYSWT